MTHEERAAWIKKIAFLLTAGTIVIGVISTFEWKEGEATSESREKQEKSGTAGDGSGDTARQGMPGQLTQENNQRVESRNEEMMISPEEGRKSLPEGVEPLLIFHHHLPGDTASEALADVFNFIQEKYGAQVEVTRVDFLKQPDLSKKQGVSKPPHVVMFAGDRQVFQFQGPASQEQVDRKVRELLIGMQRMTKDWRPPVPGMRPAGS